MAAPRGFAVPLDFAPEVPKPASAFDMRPAAAFEAADCGPFEPPVTPFEEPSLLEPGEIRQIWEWVGERAGISSGFQFDYLT